MPNRRQVLEELKRDELLDAVDTYGLTVSDRRVRSQLIEALHAVPLRDVLERQLRSRLKAVCRELGLDERGREKVLLIDRLCAEEAETGRSEKSATPSSATPSPAMPSPAMPPTPSPGSAPAMTVGSLPRPGDLAQVRGRQYLVEEVAPPPTLGDATRVRMVCLDDDDQGRALEVLWELELGARLLAPESHGLGDAESLDPPRAFAAYLDALRWSSVTATDPGFFQAPLRSGIRLLNHQLTPLKKALELPRVNLFIADDVGLGKTIEAGLVLRELLLRQRVEMVLVVCPAAICLQWRDEMKRRFGLHFEIMNRDFVAHRRRERGFGVNPWSTHQRFIISHSTLRRPEYRDPLLSHLGARVRKSLLILDEAHVAAPAGAGRWAVDSQITKVLRDVAPRFENRLFLSATPHNGHSNSFSALLELLDPQRFTRGVPVTRVGRLDAVMVRRLKSDLRALGVESFPERRVVQLDLSHGGDGWQVTSEGEAPRPVGGGEPFELRLAEMLAVYTERMRPSTKKRGRLVFVRLQQRLLSSVEAFWRTLRLHGDRMLGEGGVLGSGAEIDPPETVDQAALAWDDDEEYGPTDDAEDARDDARVTAASRHVTTPAGEARRLLEDMLDLASRTRGRPDAKALALLDWMRRHLCGGLGATSERRRAHDGPATRLDAGQRAWTDRRVIVFTEFADTKRYLHRLLIQAMEGTDRADERILHFHGGMSDAQREAVQLGFNGPPDEHPVRILLATDAAREGVNLQGWCADLFHYDIPWNPGRMEQRNGRIDRTLQSAAVVRCHYFFYPQRREDIILRTLVHKVETIQRELGSLSSVILERYAEVLDEGIDPRTGAALDAAEDVRVLRDTVRAELDLTPVDEEGGDQDMPQAAAPKPTTSDPAVLRRIEREIAEAGRLLNRSRKRLELDPAALRDVVDTGLEMLGAPILSPIEPPADDVPTFRIPELGESWTETLDALRPARGRDEPFWEWRRRPPRPVHFEPLDKMDDSRAQLHLSHPFVQRILQRFLSQGYSAHELSRVTAVLHPRDAAPRVLAFGRLSLFGVGAVRLHDELVAMASEWTPDGPAEPFADDGDHDALRRLDRLLRGKPGGRDVPAGVRERLLASSPADFAALWPHLEADAERRAREAEGKLEARGTTDADALRKILASQKRAIEDTLEAHRQYPLEFTERERAQWVQFREDEKFMQERLERIDRELDEEPGRLRELYRVVMRRFVPVGMVYLWPASRV